MVSLNSKVILDINHNSYFRDSNDKNDGSGEDKKDKRGKRKRRKNKYAPKQPKSKYNLFVREKIDYYKSMYADCSQKFLMKLVSKDWRDLKTKVDYDRFAKEEMDKYERLAAQDKKRYDMEKDETK